MTRDLLTAVAFLTRVPAGGRRGGPDVARALPWFPVVGTGVGLAVAGVYVGCRSVLPPLVAAVLGVSVGVALTGGLHEDGLADAADALAAGTPEEARRILRDPAHGTYGVVALVLSLAARIAALAALGPRTALIWIPAAHAASRGASLLLLRVLPPAAPDGLAAALTGSGWRAPAALGVGAAVATLMLGGWGPAATALAVAASLAVGFTMDAKVRGVTGDVVGAAQQIGEVLVLLLATAAVGGGWPGSAGWWG